MRPASTIRPLRQMTGDADFNEVFLDDVRVPADALVGAENDGWRALTAMLTHERLALGAGTGAGGSGASWSEASTSRFVEIARERGLTGDPVVRQELARLYTAERVLALLGQKLRDEIAAGVPVGSKGSVAKLATALLAKQAAGLAVALAGAGSVAWSPDDPDGGRAGVGRALRADAGHRRGHERDSAQHDRRACARPAQRAAGRSRHPVLGDPAEPGGPVLRRAWTSRTSDTGRRSAPRCCGPWGCSAIANSW